MYTTLAFLTKKSGMSTADFISHYETKHVPMINRLAGPENMPLVYKRRYTHRDDETRIRVRASSDADGKIIDGAGETVDFDVVTELTFESKEKSQAWSAALMKNGDNGNMVSEDEERFLDRARTRAHVIEEFVHAFLGQDYNVRATVRSEKAATNVLNTHKTCQGQSELVILPDVGAEGAFTKALKRVGGVIHTASPFVLDATNYENDLFHPVINGTVSILNAVQQHNAKVERIGIASAFTAILDPSKGLRPGYVYTNKYWNPVTCEETANGGRMVAYLALKALAELVAWEFVIREKSIIIFLVKALILHALSLHAEAEHVASYRLIMGSAQHIQRIKAIYPFLKMPIIVSAPMRVYAGPRLAVAVSNAGGLGFIGPGIRHTNLMGKLDKVVYSRLWPMKYQEDVVKLTDGGQNTMRTTLFGELQERHDWPRTYNGRAIVNASVKDAAASLPVKQNREEFVRASNSSDIGHGIESRLTRYVGNGVGLVRSVERAEEIINQTRRQAMQLLMKAADGANN